MEVIWRERLGDPWCNPGNGLPFSTLWGKIFPTYEGEGAGSGEKAGRGIQSLKGNPYHIPLLAVAMLVEDRFPQYAHVSGDIDIHQAKQAQAFIKTAVKREIALPISVDAPRLLKRIHEHYLGKEAIAHFDQIFRGNFNDKFEALFKMSDRPTFQIG